MEFKSKIKTIEWVNDCSRMVNQTLVPYEYKMVDIKTSRDMFDAIRNMIVRGAPAIGIAGAHGVVLAAMEIEKKTQDKTEFLTELQKHAEYLKSARPTAVNLMWAVDKQLELAKVNLGYTSIKSPIDGRIGKVNITEGNYVTATSGALVNVASTNPVYVTFSLKSDDFGKLLRASNQFKDVDVKVQFSDGNWYDKIGKINFVDNRIDENSGSITLRATFENPRSWLVPGDYMKVKLTAPKIVNYMTVPQACTKGDAMSGYYVWAVENNKSVRKNIEVSDEINNNWVVKDGLAESDVIVVSGIQNIAAEGQQLKPVKQSEEENNQQVKVDEKDNI